MNFVPYNSVPILEELLSKPSTPLEEVLDCDCVVSEVRNQNKKLINYLAIPDNFEKLISYVTKIPADIGYNPLDSHKEQKANKYPFIASDILAIDNDVLCQYFLGLISEPSQVHIEDNYNVDDCDNLSDYSRTSLDYQSNESHDHGKHSDSFEKHAAPITEFLRFLDQPAPINLTLAGYFSKILKTLFFYKPAVTGKYLFVKYHNLLEKMTIHAYSDNIQEILGIIIKLDPSHFKTPQAKRYLNERMDLVRRLIENIFEKPDQTLDDCSYMNLQWNSSVIISTIISQNAIIVNGKQILQNILSPENLHKFLRGVFDTSKINPLSNIILHLCEYYTQTKSPKKGLTLLDLTNFTNNCGAPEFEDNDPFLLEVLESIEGIRNCLEIENNKLNPTNIPTQFGTSYFAFGLARLKLLEVLHAFVKLRNEKIDTKISTTKLLEVLLNLMLKNPWNDVLHSTIIKILTYIINFSSDNLKISLFTEANILEFIITNTQVPEIQIKSKTSGKVQKAYISHLLALANVINNSSSEVIQGYCTQNAQWAEFTEGYLSSVNEKNNAIIGGDPVINTNFRGLPRTVMCDEKELEDMIENRIPNIEGNEEAKSIYKVEEIKDEKNHGQGLHIGLGLVESQSPTAESITITSTGGPKLGFGFAAEFDDDDVELAPKTPTSNRGNKFTPDSFEECF